ncbi:hypothetical protein [Roseitalea porphyridii]|uniref:Uncharacterized protein n=1 Tax=Roseitalea porphyridii TaxID=1852022 RepID=A0A4P6V1Y2_9HYPH|nr:hypothetical protein [Roseitalea porphyridii]QBK30586.1 hypothetical protein E0E05_08255 [Roseitalea porphyridii]
MTLCRLVVGALVVLWAFALFILAVGTFGWFGQERDPLSGIFLVVLGQPWVMAIDALPGPLRPWAAALAPLINIALVAALCSALGRRSRSSG